MLKNALELIMKNSKQSTLKPLLTISLLVWATSAQAATITTSHLTDKLDMHLPTVNLTARATLRIETIPDTGPSALWDLGTFTPDDVGRVVIATPDAPGTVAWDLLNAYTAGDINITETINANPLVARTEWQLLRDDHRGQVLELRFKLEAFEYTGNVGYVAGTYQMTFEHMPEPSTLVLLLPAVLLRRRAR